MKRATATLLALLAAALLAPAAASADKDFDKYRLESLSTQLSSAQAGAHADFTIDFRLTDTGEVPPKPNAFTRDIVAELPPGLVGNPEAFPKCSLADFGAAPGESHCPQDAQIGVLEIELAGSVNTTLIEPLYNMEAPGGDIVARLGFFAGLYPGLIDARLDPEDHTLIAAVQGAAAAAELIGSRNIVWGVPPASVHDALRVTPQEAIEETLPPGGRDSGLAEIPFFSNPTECATAKQVRLTAISYQRPGSPSTLSAAFPQLGGCESLEFNPSASATPSTTQASSSSGLDFDLSLPTKGLEFANLSAPSHLKRTEVTLPEGMTVNPSAAEGLGVCSQADLARETYDSGPNAGCPENSKLGSVTATTPVLDRDAKGSLYLAKPYENPFGSLLALYLVVKIPDRGVLVRVPGKVTPDPKTGQLVTVFDDIPQLPVATVSLDFREGARAPLITPPTCGTYETEIELTPWARPDQPVHKTSSLKVESGPNHGPCPAGGTPPFHPGFLAGTDNNAAGSFSPFFMRLTREDTDQDLTKFSAILPPGLVAKLAGTTRCPDAAIAQARGRTGQNGGHEELSSPSCPATSEIGNVLAGAGVGSVLTYAKGKVYLAGPYNGAPLSVVGVVPAVAGPFDVGTVVTRQALRLNPRTGIVTVDGESSDPIPHILAGIPLKVRDIRVYVDRENFTLNPTSCDPFSIEATLWGGGNDVFSTADDSPYGASSRFQAADCAKLGFKPRLSLRLKGGTERGGHPALRGTFRPRKGDANLKGLVLRLPRSAFLDQAHIRTICTRVQFAAKGGNGAGCPKGSIYGRAKAFTPILDEPLTGPVYLRSSNHNLPDFVAALHGLVDVEAVARIDSKGGGIRATFTGVPDAPLTKVVVDMQGAKKGLIVNSRNLCFAPEGNRASALFRAHNGRSAKGRPVVRATGCRTRRASG